ncbi:hypothetical protein OHS33_32865 [Streptomyces sp. NBC_00536]|uniref:hypothetical protein n=1 Tax=Streptomyces sp. NBC_00536 TaxID=2975769 RepID=UPI002E80609D|nr:hypothetical protein [Streptomyces sp. NBC_00536]WUC82736.1 hypothetical protein OHS33_32865 [Streptomyces sp. NBC_00536]
MSARAAPVPVPVPVPEAVPVSVPAPPVPAGPVPAPGAAPAPAGAVPGGPLAEELALQGGAALTATPATAAHLDTRGAAGGPVRVRLGQMAAGTLNLRRADGNGLTLTTGPGDAFQPVPLLHPLLHPLRAEGIEPVLALRVHDGVLEGHASAVVKGRLLTGGRALLDLMEQHPRALGWAGLGGLRLPGVENELRGTTLVVGVTGMSFTLGGFLSATGSFGLAGEVVTFDAVARGAVAGLGAVEVPVRRGPDGALTGSASVDVLLRGFTGQVTAAFAAGAVDVRGTVRYANEKFDGEVTLVATDAKTAKELTDGKLPDAKAPDPAKAAAAPSASAPAAAAPGPRVVAGWGTLHVRLADWLSGEALVIVDHHGDVTVVGKISPRMDKPLFADRHYQKQLARFEVRAAYGVPLVGNVFLFANIGLEALAVLGPATLDHIELTGTWSTKPEVLRDFGLTATLNVSASAGLRLTAEGGAGATLVGHDIKAGLALSALAAVRGYVEATPRIGYREVADPKAGKHGEFFLAGHMEIAAQPFLGLGGELFVELDSPWWSPVPDHRWNWPLFQREYPLPGEFGIGADVEHVVGSGKVPEVTFGEVNFSPDKFLADLVDDRMPAKTAKDEPRRGAWTEPGAAAPPARAGAGPAAGAPAAKPPAVTPAPAGAKPGAAKPGAAKPVTEEAVVPAPAVQERWLTGLKALGAVAERSHHDPYDATELRAALAGLKKAHGFTALEAELHGGAWQITASMNPTTRNLPPIDADTTAKPVGEVAVPDDAEAYAHLIGLNRRMEAVGAKKVGQGSTAVERAILRDAYPDLEPADVTRGMVLIHIRELNARKAEEIGRDTADKEAAQKSAERAGKKAETVYDTVKNTQVPGKDRDWIYRRAQGKDEYGENPIPRGSWSLDHVVAKKEFAEIPDVARLWPEERLELVHQRGNLRMQEKGPNSSRQEVPWPQWGGARKWYPAAAVNRAVGWYHEAKALLLGQIAKILGSRPR